MATVAKATKRSGFAATTSASFSFWMRISFSATSRLAPYQNGLMLSAWTSMPCASIHLMRSAVSLSVAGTIFTPSMPLASGNAQCAWMSTVLTRLPLTTISPARALGMGMTMIEKLAAGEDDRPGRAGCTLDEVASRLHARPP